MKVKGCRFSFKTAGKGREDREIFAEGEKKERLAMKVVDEVDEVYKVDIHSLE